MHKPAANARASKARGIVPTEENSVRDRNGWTSIYDTAGVLRWTDNPADRDDVRSADYDINIHRLRAVERLIEARYGGSCDCDGDVECYLSVALNALVLSRRSRRRKATINSLMRWVHAYCPVADMKAARGTAEKVIANPRRMSAKKVGVLLGLTTAERSTLGIRFIDPADDPGFGRRKAQARREAARRRSMQDRRAAGAQPRQEYEVGSLAAYCRRNNLNRSSMRAAMAKGADALARFLARKGVKEPPPGKVANSVAVSEKVPLSNRRTDMATFGKDAAGGLSRPADKGRCSVIEIERDAGASDDEADLHTAIVTAIANCRPKVPTLSLFDPSFKLPAVAWRAPVWPLRRKRAA